MSAALSNQDLIAFLQITKRRYPIKLDIKLSLIPCHQNRERCHRDILRNHPAYGAESLAIRDYKPWPYKGQYRRKLFRLDCDSYRTGSGEFLAAASVAGTAALIKSYFPKLTGSQIRDILLRSVTSRRGAEVEKGIRVDDNATQDLFLFEDLCASGGILNAYQAIVEAEKTAKK